MTELALEVERREAATIVVVRGELDIATAPQLRECLAQTIDAGVRIVVDLEAVPA